MKNTKTFAIGVDLGATTIKAGAVTRKGEILHTVVHDTKANKGPLVVVQQVTFALKDLLSRFKMQECIGIGIGAPGIVTTTDGIVRHPPNFTDWAEFDLARAIRKNYPVTVFIENDANVAAIAEAKYGAGAEHRDFLFVIWGTGVGGGIILNKKIYRGPHGGAGEIGHISIDYNGRKCNCGNLGCIESYIGQRYLSQRTREIIEARDVGKKRSRIEELVDGKLEKIEPALISRAAEDGDTVAIDILTEAGELLGAALASVMNILDIRVVVIGGGISAAPQFVFSAVEASAKARVLKPHQKGVRILRAKFGNNAGIVGAASLVL